MENSTLSRNKNIGCSTGQLSSVSNRLSSRDGSEIGNSANDSTINPFKIVYIIFGVLFCGLGAIGTVIPLIPTTPLILMAAVCFGKSSRRLNSWFLSTRLYRRTIDGFIHNRTMTIKTKMLLLSSITVFMGISFTTMLIFRTPVILQALLATIWLCHVIYFGFIVKTTRY